MRTETAGQLPILAVAESDTIQPFQLDRSRLRGRMIRLGPALDIILGRHDYPPLVAGLLAENITLAALLAAMLKYEGIFTLQTKGDGPVSFTVADVTSAGDLRGYASFDGDRLPASGDGETAEAGAEGRTGAFRPLLGDGYLAFTVDQGEHTERYQGIVALDGETLEDCVRHYFHQSEQLATGLRIAVKRDKAGHWQAGAIMVQALPEEDAGKTLDRKPSDLEDDWRRAMIMLGTCTDQELLDPALPVNDLLYRLFHEEIPRVFARQTLQPGCRCTEERILGVLQTLPPDDIEHLLQDGKIVVTCEFCSKSFGMDPAVIRQSAEA